MLVLRYSRLAFLMNDDRTARSNRLTILRDIHYENRASAYRNQIQRAVVTQTDIANRFISAACDKICLKDVDFLLGHQTHLKDYNKRQIFIGLITKEMDAVAGKDFYASLKLNTDILAEEIKDQD